MKVIFITREGFNLAGARVRCYRFAGQLKKHGFDTEVLSFCDHLGAKDGINEKEMGLSQKLLHNREAFIRLRREKDAIFYIQRFNYHTLAPYLVHLLHKNRFILDLDDWEMREDPKYYFGFYPNSKAHFFTRQIAKRSACCIAASRYLEDFLKGFNRNVFYLPSGVDPGLFRPSLNGLADEKIIFSWIGTLHKKEYIENIELAMECFAGLRKEYGSIYFEILADGAFKEGLIRAIERFNDPHIMLKEWVHPDEVPEYLGRIHIGLFPVARDNKFNRAKSPVKLFEYMASAKPVVASAIGEPQDIIRDGEDGFLAATKEEFGAKMRRLIRDASLRKEMGQRARQTIEEKYSLAVLGKRLSAILNRL
ncbi:MAG: glycosyltransferase family 4 protein [Candidatus Omnitrophica bacterium]|nr:glycosyltransferase family 4 protein [Candidatus Omnitrophota bacterium]